jgi:hypothetical protein
MESPATTTQRWARTARSAAASCRLAPHRSASADHCQLSRAPTPHVARLGGPGQLRGAQRHQWSLNKVTAEVQTPRVDAHRPAELKQLPPGRRPARPVARVEQRGTVVAILELKGPPLGPAQRLRCVAHGAPASSGIQGGKGRARTRLCARPGVLGAPGTPPHRGTRSRAARRATRYGRAARASPARVPHRPSAWLVVLGLSLDGVARLSGSGGRPSETWSGANLQPAELIVDGFPQWDTSWKNWQRRGGHSGVRLGECGPVREQKRRALKSVSACWPGVRLHAEEMQHHTFES